MLPTSCHICLSIFLLSAEILCRNIIEVSLVYNNNVSYDMPVKGKVNSVNSDIRQIRTHICKQCKSR